MKNVLIADDDAGLRALVEATLESKEYALRVTPDGAAALEAILQDIPDLVILDMDMPKITGLELCRRLKADPKFRSIAVLMLTGNDEQREQSLAAGAIAYLTKPFSPLQLMELVEDSLRVQQPAPLVSTAWLSEPGTTSKLAAFMFVDIRDFTGITSRHGDEVAYRMAHELQRIVRLNLKYFDGKEINTAGDNVSMYFATARQALQAGMSIIEAVSDRNAAGTDIPLMVGVGADVGAPVDAAGDFFGATMNLAARVTAAAKPGELLVTETMRRLAGEMEGVAYVDRGRQVMKGLKEPQQVYGVAWAKGLTYAAPPAETRLQTLRHRLTGSVAKMAFGGGLVVLLSLATVFLAGSAGLGMLGAPRDQAVRGAARVVTNADIVNDSRPFTVLISSKSREGAALGTGVIYDASGLVVTNAHVVADAATVDLYLANGATVTGNVVGRSAQPDLAVIRIAGGPYSPVASFGESSTVRAGDEILILGYPNAFQLKAQASANRGIVSQAASGLNGQFIQVDAPMNPGVSGGPLLNAKGQVVGINVARFESGGGRSFQGIGFAIPSDIVREALPGLERGAPAAGPAGAAGQAQLLSPVQVTERFHRLIHAGEFGVAYSLVSSRFKASLSPQAFAQRYGYADKVGAQVFNAQQSQATGDSAVVTATVLISELSGDSVKATWHDQQWGLVKEGQEWRLDSLMSDTSRPAE